MAATPENPHSDAIVNQTPVGQEILMSGGAIYANVTPENKPFYTVITHGNEFSNEHERDEHGNETKFRKLAEKERRIITVDPDEDEIWLLDENNPAVTNRVRFMGPQVEFTHFNGTEPAPVAVFGIIGGRLQEGGTEIPDGASVNIPQQVPVSELLQAERTLQLLKRGVPYSFSFRQANNLATLPDRLELFSAATPEPSLSTA